MTGMMVFDELNKAVAETTKSLSGMTGELSRTTQSLNNAGGASRNLRSDMGTVASGASEAGGGVEHLIGTLYDLAAAAGIAFSVEKVIEWGKEVMNVTAEMQGYDNRIKFASLDTDDATKNMAFLKKEVKDLHLPIKGVYEGFSQMEAGLMGTGIEGEKLRKLVWGIGEAAATVHLNEADMGGTLLALKEIGEVGLNMRLEKMLIRDLPGVGNAVKKAFGKSMSELGKEGMSGPQFLEGLGPALDAYYKSGVANYSTSLQASMVDTANLLYLKQVEVGEKLEGFYKGIMADMRSFIVDIGADIIKAIDWVNSHFSDISSDISRMSTNIRESLSYIDMGGVMKSVGDTVSSFFHDIWSGIKPLIDSLWQFKDQFIAVFGFIGSAVASSFKVAGEFLGWLWKVMAGVVDVLHTVYVALDEIGVVYVLVGIFQNLYGILEKVGGFLKSIYDNILKPIFERIAWVYDKVKGLLGIETQSLASDHTGYSDSYQKAEWAPGSHPYETGTGDKGVNETLSGQRTNISAAGEGNKVRNVIITVEKMIGVENMTYDQHRHDPRHIEQVVSNMLVNSTRDAEIALGRN